MLKSLVKELPRTLMTIKVSEKELKELKDKADCYAGGNISAWLRYAGLKYVPEKKELCK